MPHTGSVAMVLSECAAIRHRAAVHFPCAGQRSGSAKVLWVRLGARRSILRREGCFRQRSCRPFAIPGPMSSDSMVTAAPSAWRTMETALQGLSTTVLVVAVLTAILVIVSLLSILRGNVDLSFLLAIAVFLALRDVLAFSRGAMDRMRQLGELV